LSKISYKSHDKWFLAQMLTGGVGAGFIHEGIEVPVARPRDREAA